jgi:osmoprotectant transport system ATP-binding protein
LGPAAADVSEYAAEFLDVSLRRGDVLALEKVSLALPLRQCTAILGASGSGKSTLVQLIIGLLRPDMGTVRTLGTTIDYDNPRPLRRRIGYAVQEVALFPHLKIRQNILLPAMLSYWPEPDAASRLAELLELMQLPDGVLDRYPHELSGGQQQRAGLCRAMMLHPELLLLDEPFSGLDTLTRRSIHEQFLLLQEREAVSCALVTHDPQEAINLAQHIAVMKDGRLQQFGTVRKVMNEPANVYVRDLCTGLSTELE